MVKETFLFQGFDTGFEFDFQYLIKSQVNNTFCEASKDFYVGYAKIDQLDRIQGHETCIPIGSIEFVLNFFKTHYNYIIQPINIPDQLIPRFLNR